MPDPSATTAEAVAAAFAALEKGDVSGFALDYTHLGYDITGRPRIFKSRNEFLTLMGRMNLDLAENTTEVSSVTPCGDDLVMMGMNAYRRNHDGRVFRGQFVMAFRVEQGVLTRGTDLVSGAGEKYWTSLGLSPS